MSQLRTLPSIDQLLQREEVRGWQERYPRQHIVDSLRQAVSEARERLRARGEPTPTEQIVLRAGTVLQQSAQPSLVPVINATGVLLHTNLGRAPLSPRALEEVRQLCSGYCNLELELDTGERGHRHLHLQPLWSELTGAPASLVVNNCAAAVLLIMDEFARDREVLVSRGELVEIGGSFRIPDVITRCGARLREVGTTNRTYVSDFRAALNEHSAMLLSTHLSNFCQQGFVHSPAAEELVELARETGLVSVLDLGSGLLEPSWVPAGVEEPSIRAAVAQGWDLIAFSGDKLLGAAQSGVILGNPELVARLARNPWMRALRLDKLRLAALQGALLDLQFGPEQVPLLRMLREPEPQVRRRAQRLLRRLRARLGSALELELRPSQASLGGGTTPAQTVASWAVCLRPAGGLDDLAARLRSPLLGPAVLARRQAGWLWLDLRCVGESQIRDLEEAVVQAVA